MPVKNEPAPDRHGKEKNLDRPSFLGANSLYFAQNDFIMQSSKIPPVSFEPRVHTSGLHHTEYKLVLIFSEL